CGATRSAGRVWDWTTAAVTEKNSTMRTPEPSDRRIVIPLKFLMKYAQGVWLQSYNTSNPEKVRLLQLEVSKIQRGQAPLPDLFFFMSRSLSRAQGNEQVRKRGLPPP